MTTDIQVFDPEVLPPIDAELIERAEVVRQALLEAKKQAENGFLDLCDLLLEAKEGAYHQVWGYSEFGNWVENGSGLSLHSRQAYYFINMAKSIRQLGLSREQVLQSNVSNLKKIFTLDPNEYGEDIKRLVAESPEMSLEEVKSAVREVLAKDGLKPPEYITLKLDAMVKETFDRAIELARLNYGSTVDQEGEPTEITISKALELICVEYLNNSNNVPEGMTLADVFGDTIIA